jgi:hypothetical protein
MNVRGCKERMVGYVSLDFDSPTLQDFRRYGSKDGKSFNHREVILVQDEMAGGFKTLPYITRKLLNHREIVRPPEADSGCDSLESHGDPSLRSGRDSFSRLLALAQFL